MHPQVRVTDIIWELEGNAHFHVYLNILNQKLWAKGSRNCICKYMFHVPQAFGTLDTVADFSHIEKVYWAMKNVVNKEFPDARFIGHFSHWYEWGCMLYARFIFPGDKVPPNEREAAALYNAVWDKAIRAAIANGGVINEHHGVGLKLGRYVKDLYGTAMPVLEGVKRQLDPNGIMNPGKLGFAGC